MDASTFEAKANKYGKDLGEYLAQQGICFHMMDGKENDVDRTFSWWPCTCFLVDPKVTSTTLPSDDPLSCTQTVTTSYADWLPVDALFQQMRVCYQEVVSKEKRAIAPIRWVRFVIEIGKNSNDPFIRFDINEAPRWAVTQQGFDTFVRSKCPEEAKLPEYEKILFTKTHPVAVRCLAKIATQEKRFRSDREAWRKAEAHRPRTELLTKHEHECKAYAKLLQDMFVENGIACEITECPPQGFAHNTIQLSSNTGAYVPFCYPLKAYTQLLQSQDTAIERLQMCVQPHETGAYLYWNANEECNDDLAEALVRNRDLAEALVENEDVAQPSPSKRARKDAQTSDASAPSVSVAEAAA